MNSRIGVRGWFSRKQWLIAECVQTNCNHAFAKNHHLSPGFDVIEAELAHAPLACFELNSYSLGRASRNVWKSWQTATEKPGHDADQTDKSDFPSVSYCPIRGWWKNFTSRVFNQSKL
jgi:hypothetical protein